MTEPAFRSGLYRGTARADEQFRPAYPAELRTEVVGLRGRAHRQPRRPHPVGRTGRLLDLARGTGQAAFPLPGAFAEERAVDQEPG